MSTLQSAFLRASEVAISLYGKNVWVKLHISKYARHYLYHLVKYQPGREGDWRKKKQSTGNTILYIQLSELNILEQMV